MKLTTVNCFVIPANSDPILATGRQVVGSDNEL